MTNNKLFKERISDNLYADVLDYFKKLHNEKISIENLDETINKKAKIQKVGFVASGTVGLVTIGMAILNYTDVYKLSQDVMTVASFSCLAMSYVSTRIHNGIESLREEFRNRLTNSGPLQSIGEFYKFEEKLVSDLNLAGIPVKLQAITDYEEYQTIRDLWKTSQNVDTDLRVKTAEYVKNMMSEYAKPEALKPPKPLRPY